MFDISQLKIKIFADGADLNNMIEMNNKNYIKGLTTNPTLMKKAGIYDYVKFANEVLAHVQEKPVSFEVFSDDIEDIKRQGKIISSWGKNVYVKIPISTTNGNSTIRAIDYLVNLGVKINVTALMTCAQVYQVSQVLNPNIPSYVSVFAGRIADTGVDPIDTMVESIDILKQNINAELIWASPREILNVIQADKIGCHVITATTEILNKIPLLGYNLNEYSLDTVKMFRKDALESGFVI